MPQPSLGNRTHGGLFYLPADRQPLPPPPAPIRAWRIANLSQSPTASAALTRLGQALHFPDWYGANFDALHDCLGDPDWLGNGAAVLIDGLDTLRDRDRQAWSTLLDVFRSATERDAGHLPPLWIVLTTPAPGVANLPTA